jgi:hypothetical protein
LLWQRRDIFASDDAAATAAAQDLYRTYAAKRISNELPSLRQFWKIDLQTQMMPSGKGGSELVTDDDLQCDRNPPMLRDVDRRWS